MQSPAPQSRRGAPVVRQTVSPRVIVVTVVGLVAAVALMWLVVRASGSEQVDVRLGDDEFEVGNVERFAAEIADNGPLLFQDLLVGGTRDLRINHTSEDPRLGWYAFEARVPGSERRCNVEWQSARERFVDPCTGQYFPADGGSLPRYPVRVTEAGRLYVDLTPGGEPGRASTTAAG